MKITMKKHNATEREAAQYARKRAQAQRNAVSKAKKAVGRLARRSGLKGTVSDEAEQELIENIVLFGYEYAEAAGRYLYDEDNGIREYMDGIHFGKTYRERVEEQVDRLVDDMGKILVAAEFLKMPARLVEDEWEDPYFVGNSIRRANSRGAGIEIPSYGQGIPLSGAEQLLKNIDNTVAIAWGYEDYDYALRNGALGFYVFRGSSYPCQTCQEQVGVFHPMEESVWSHPPFHNNCVCYVVYVYGY